MTLIYLATPYSHELDYIRQRRFEEVNEVASKLMREGMMIFSPISHGHPIALAGGLPTHFEYWRQYCYWTLTACRELMVLTSTGWRDSVGVSHEIVTALSQSKPIRYVSVVDGDIVITDEPQ